MKTMIVGTYTKKEGHVDGQADGIIALKVDPQTGKIPSQHTVAQVVNPSFVKVSKNGKFLFAVSELGSGDAPSGYFYSFEILKNDSLKKISRLSTEGFAPAHIALDQTGKYAFVSNYMGGVVMVYAINENGSLKKQQRVDLEDPEKSHAHSVTISPDNSQAYIADLGNDKIWIYNFDAEKGILSPHDQVFEALESGSGPRHFTIAGNGKTAYSVNELNSTVSVFEILENGGLKVQQYISTLPEVFSGKNSTADIHLHPSGDFLYVSNRGHNSITAFKVDKNGMLSVLGHFSTQGETPRNFVLSPSGDWLYVANQDSNSIVLFKVDEATGNLDQKAPPYEVKTPVCLEFQ
ncbi:lactonase family protein [Salinimicrobium sp. HB62]|uniref:lactonase family protein n=1 Tax=Salinimicrobium sp. HB62 TaxID=3077781 RepID=UPI002D78B17D|nr:lactonase family protein [Salinimicrobium sp. HB62]